MKTCWNRLWRQDQPVRGRVLSARRQRARWALILSLVAAALAAAPARAEMGGISSLVVDGPPEAQESAFTPLRWAGATWYGPGFYGGRTACGQVLRPGTIGVAHRSLPCGTTVKFLFRGRQIVTTVIDRGPYGGDEAWDLTNGARQQLGFDGAGPIRYAVPLEYAGKAAVPGRAPR
jgi:rare lipoprotein A